MTESEQENIDWREYRDTAEYCTWLNRRSTGKERVDLLTQLEYKPKRIPKSKKQVKSLPGQLGLFDGQQPTSPPERILTDGFQSRLGDAPRVSKAAAMSVPSTNGDNDHA